MFLKSAKTGKRVFELKLNNVSQCVLPGNSKDEVEIQFHESDSVDKEEDMLVHVRLRFPPLPEKGEDGEEEEEPDMTPAETFQKNIMERGMIRSVTGNVIAEFTQDQGIFVTPRGRYAIQVMIPSLVSFSPSSPCPPLPVDVLNFHADAWSQVRLQDFLPRHHLSLPPLPPRRSQRLHRHLTREAHPPGQPEVPSPGSANSPHGAYHGSEEQCSISVPHPCSSSLPACVVELDR
jgi:hypothetical protein